MSQGHPINRILNQKLFSKGPHQKGKQNTNIFDFSSERRRKF
jgi:hypothetical protein